MLNSTERKKIVVITKYATTSFSENDWHLLGQITGKLSIIINHPRLLRSMSFGDDDYELSAAQVLNEVFTTENSEDLIQDVIDHFDIDLWYQQKYPDQYLRIFNKKQERIADFWKTGYIKMFISHLTSNKARMSALKSSLANWGISAFVAHEDIQASREWRDEVEIGLETMEIFVAVVEPGFKESDWCTQEVGYALGRKVDIIPLNSGLAPFGFFGKYQGIPIKGKLPNMVACDIARLILQKTRHREKMMQCILKAFTSLGSEKKIDLITKLDGWSVVRDEQLCQIIEQSSLSTYEKQRLQNLIARIGAFKNDKNSVKDEIDDIPF